MRYKGAPLDLEKKMKPQVELEKEKVQMLLHNYEQLTSLIGNIQDSYVWLCNSLDVMVRTHMIPSIGSLTDAKTKNQVILEIDEYLTQLRREATIEDLELSAHNIQKYIDGINMVKNMFFMLHNELDIGSKTIYPECHGGKSLLSERHHQIVLGHHHRVPILTSICD